MKNNLIQIIKDNLLEILPELQDQEISTTETFVDLGANSVDRGELITLTLEKLDLDVSRIEFVTAETIDQLADLLMEKQK
ncbi:phosphopantetheine-binding protein [uncultured Aquimarina sp.]|uniref:phosphopantetheine-binding protein n=1 Tax=uncultured Aquimarina sp. TaxID=575652 RepID=UPI002624A335|nr:phosphopantetheine-binding protein [uncultured Aquimarina sp.]